MTFLSFSTGSLASVALSPELKYWALAIPLGTSCVTLLATRLVSRILDERFAPQIGGAQVKAS